MRSVFAALGFLLAALPAYGQDVTSIAEFDGQTGQERGSTISSALTTIFNHYSETNLPKATCMAKLFIEPSSASSDSTIRGYTLLVHEIERERGDPPADQRSVERIIFDIVHKECGTD